MSLDRTNHGSPAGNCVDCGGRFIQPLSFPGRCVRCPGCSIKRKVARDRANAEKRRAKKAPVRQGAIEPNTKTF